MTDFDFSQTNADHIITHHIGNPTNDEALVLSEDATEVSEETMDYLLEYFLSPFKPQDFMSFTHPEELAKNEVYQMVRAIFAQADTLVEHSKSLAKLLYDRTAHPNIKSGELNVVYLSNIIYAGEVVDAIGIFKSEEDMAFLKMKYQETGFKIDHDFGYYLKGIDKACIVFDVDESEGYSALVVDHTNKNKDAQYWIDDFLQLTPRSDAYNHTKDFLNVAKNFVTQQLPEEYEVSKTDKIDLLNRTLDYFKHHDSFEKEDFAEDVFQDEGIKESFSVYEKSYRDEQGVSLQSEFDISAEAVKKQARIFKSVLKLDKNFSIYIHGDKNLIEKGVEPDGRKFYKIYYEKEK